MQSRIQNNIRDEVNIGIITALPEEFAAMKVLLDNGYEDTIEPSKLVAGNRYFLGEIPAPNDGKHTVALALLPDMGNNFAASIAVKMQMHYKSIKMLFVTGIAGGVPSKVRLGDVVISEKGVFQYDYGKQEPDRFIERDNGGECSAYLLQAVKLYRAKILEEGATWREFLARIYSHLEEDFSRPNVNTEFYYRKNRKNYSLTERNISGRSEAYYGKIASGNIVQKDPSKRDALHDKHDIIAIEMEGSGVRDAVRIENNGYLVIRGICDYCDKAKNDEWHNYAAAVAAAYTRGLIGSLPPISTVEDVELEIIYGNAKKYFTEYKRRHDIHVDTDILALVEPDAADGVSSEVSMYTLMIDQCGKGNVVLLYGDGGAGKSHVLFDCYDKLLADRNYLPIYIPMKDIRPTDSSPVLQYAFDKYFNGIINWKREPDSLKSDISYMLNGSNVQFIFILDGVNEFAINASTHENRIVEDEIRWLGENKKALVIVSSRGRKSYEDAYAIKVKPLDSGRVRAFLKAHENTSSIDLSQANDKLVKLLQLPLLLSLFAKTYSPQYMSVNETDINSVTKHSDILQLCVEYHKTKLHKTSEVNYVLDVLLPLVSLDTDMKMNVEKWELVKMAYQEFQITLSNDYKRLWLNRDNYDRHKIAELGGGDEFELFRTLIGETILDNAMFLIENDQTISWQHELLLDWFVPKGIVLSLRYRRSFAERKIEDISDIISKADVRADGIFPVAMFLYEMLEATPESDAAPFVLLISAIARSYHNAKDIDNIYKFASLALLKIDSGAVNGWSLWMKADLMQHDAYLLMTVPEAKMSGNIGLDICENYLKEALKTLDAISGDKENDNANDKASEFKIRLTKAQIYGNLGAYCLAKRRATGDLSFVRKAIDNHERGYKIRKQLFKDYPDKPNNDSNMGTSHHCLATDYFYLGELEESLKHHRAAIKYREKPGSPDIRKVESYTRCIATINKLITGVGTVGDKNGGWLTGYVEETIKLYHKALECTACFLKNCAELKTLESNCAATIGFTNEYRDILKYEDIEAVRDIAGRIDTLCAEVSMPSDLFVHIKE
jgi:nucleoside phosphorylase